MRRAKRAIILSDLHLGPEGPLATFSDDGALAAYFGRLADEADALPTELVLAGDCFDFLQTPGYDGFSAGKAIERFDAILAAPRTKAVIDALRRFAARPECEITLLSGNHDPELLVDDVRRRFEEAIGRVGTVLHADDEPLYPAEGKRPPVWGRALGGGAIWVVHGDRWDPVNMIHRGEARAAILKGQPVTLPTGSHLVFEVLQRIKPARPWVDELKPELGVFLLLLYLDFETTAAYLKKHHGISGALMRGKIEAKLRLGTLFGVDVAGGSESVDPTVSIAALLAESLREEQPAARDVLLAQIAARFEGERAAAAGTLAAHDGVRRLLIRAGLRWMRHTDRFQDPRGPDEIQAAATRRLPQDVRALIAGHTHGPRARPELTPAYFNSGTWVPIGRIPPGALDGRIDELDYGPTWPTSAPRTFVEVELNVTPPRIRLRRCDVDGTPREVEEHAGP